MSNSRPPESEHDDQPKLSPLRPKRPDAFRLPEQPAQRAGDDGSDGKNWPTEPNTPSERLAIIRQKMEEVANEYAERKISRAQFNAIYAHYSEQRALIERIISRDPQNEGWKQAARSGKTDFLREHFEARPVNYVIYLHRQNKPLMGGGTRPDMQRIASLLRALWGMEKLRVGVARLALKSPYWLIMAAGYYSVTFVTFHLEPSGVQANRVKDLHEDFERANRIFLERGRINKARLVYPQRALLEQKKS